MDCKRKQGIIKFQTDKLKNLQKDPTVHTVLMDGDKLYVRTGGTGEQIIAARQSDVQKHASAHEFFCQDCQVTNHRNEPEVSK